MKKGVIYRVFLILLTSLVILNIMFIVNAETEKIIKIDLEYNKDSTYDEDNDGEESVSGIVDLTVENTEFNWDVDESKLCARWKTYSENEDKATTFCYGSEECCNFVELVPSGSNWNEPYYGALNRYGAGLNNIVSAQVIYYDVDLSSLKSEILNSEWGKLPVKFYYGTISSADSIEDKINSIVKYGEQYEMGQISYLQMLVHSTVLRHDINEMLSEKIEINVDGPLKYGASEEEMRSIFGAPADITPWVWVAHEDKEMRIDERMPYWEKTVFDGKKLKIIFNAWPNVLKREDGSLTKFYVFDFDTRFKRRFDFNVDSMSSYVKNMAESFLETNEGEEELAEKMLEYKNILHHYIAENRENCLKTIKEFFEDDEKRFDKDITRWEIFPYEGDNLEVRAEVTSCDGCEWPNVDIWFDVRIRDARSKEGDLKFKKFDKEKYRAMTIDELNSLIEKNVERLVKKAEQADESRSGNIIRDKIDMQSEIRVISQVLDEKYYGGKEKEEIQENYRARMQVLEDIFSKYGDIYKYPLKEVRFERILLQNIEERQDSWCRELKHDECSNDDVCWEGECINASGGDETCDNRIDDDGDHAIDCDDPDCSLECGRACDYICSKECGECYEKQCGDICREKCQPCNEENKDKMTIDYNPCEAACQECSECMDTKCNSQPVCDECTACHEETYKCFGICNSCDKCKEQGLGGCEEQCGECDKCKATDRQRECLDFCEILGDEIVDEDDESVPPEEPKAPSEPKELVKSGPVVCPKIKELQPYCPDGETLCPPRTDEMGCSEWDCNACPQDDEHIIRCKELCKQDVVFICPTGKQYIPCDNVYYLCNGTSTKIPCIIYECEGGTKQTAPCNEEIMCGVNQYVALDKCVCEKGYYDCDDNDKDCESKKKCQQNIEQCEDKIDNDGDNLIDCEDLLDCKTGTICSDEPMYCYEGACISTTCGNGVCDANETRQSCPPDCKLKHVCGDDICSGNENEKNCPQDCLICPEGQILNKKGICVDPEICPIGHINVNGTCVPPPKECLEEGEYTMEVKDCCTGLKAIRTQVGDGRICSLTAGYVCTALCGDGNCGDLENPCNCKKDCPITEENVSCTTNADCGTDICHQGRNICSEHRFICENGQCSEVSTKYEDYSCARYYSPELPYPQSTKCLDSCGDGICKHPENKNWCPEDCMEKELCGNNVIDPGENCANCPQDVKCEEGFYCKNNECIPRSEVCPEGMELNEFKECVDICGNGRIDEKEDCESCPKDVRCEEGFYCKNKKCVPIPKVCPEGMELNEVEECVDICGNGRIDEKEDCESCPQDVSCGDDFICKNKKCVPRLEVCPEGMEADEDDKCVDICGNGRIDEKEDCDSCPEDVSCSDNFICKNKKCVPEKITCPDGYVLNEEGICELIIECKENQKLTEQGCVPIEDDCKQDDDCIGKEECKAGVCVAPPRPKCETDEECPQNKICSDGICVKNIETPGPAEPEPTGEECILISDCSGENDICSNGKCKEIPKEFVEEEEEIPKEEPKEKEEEKKKEEKEEKEEEEIPEEEPEEPEPVEEKPEQEEKEKKKEKEPEPEITGGSVFDAITGFVTSILGLAVEDAENGCKEDSDCGINQNCDPFMGECHCKEYFFDCNSRDGQGNDEDGCESEDPTCGGERKICEECKENQYCDEKRGHCECNAGFWDCDGYWGNGCESEKGCEGCKNDSDCMQDVCAPWDIKTVINIGCVQGSTWMEETGVLVFDGGCNFRPTGVIEPHLGFNAWGERFEQVQWYQEAMEQFERHWCDFELGNLIKRREELQESYNQEFLEWFFEEFVNSEPDRWDDYQDGIYDIYWRIAGNSWGTNQHLRCLNLKKFPSEYELISEIEYESENGYIKFWEEKAVLDGVEIFSPYMQVWVFPPKEFVRENFRSAMERGVMPGPPKNEELGPTPAEIKEAKENEKFMEEITDISDDFGGSADFLITINDEEEILYKAILTINPDIIFNFQVKDIENIEPDVTISVDFEFMYELIGDIEKSMELQKPPWDERPRMKEKIKGAMDKGKILAKITGAIATGKIKVSPLSQAGKVTEVLRFMFEQGPKEKGPKEKDED